jgi:hypothetical protein
MMDLRFKRLVGGHRGMCKMVVVRTAPMEEEVATLENALQSDHPDWETEEMSGLLQEHTRRRQQAVKRPDDGDHKLVAIWSLVC